MLFTFYSWLQWGFALVQICLSKQLSTASASSSSFSSAACCSITHTHSHTHTHTHTRSVVCKCQMPRSSLKLASGFRLMGGTHSHTLPLSLTPSPSPSLSLSLSLCLGLLMHTHLCLICSYALVSTTQSLNRFNAILCNFEAALSTSTSLPLSTSAAQSDAVTQFQVKQF